MKLFSETVQHTITNSTLNILQVRDYNEIFFNIFEVELNENKYPLEKIASYKGNPVVSVPVVVEGEEREYPFVLMKGVPEVLFNENNVEVPEDTTVYVDDFDSYMEEKQDTLVESKQEILEQIANAKANAQKHAIRIKKQKIAEANQEISKKNKALTLMVEQARDNLVDEFTKILKNVKSELVDTNDVNYTEIKETLDNQIAVLSDDLKIGLKNNFQTFSKQFDKKLKEGIRNMYSVIVEPKLTKELTEIAQNVVDKLNSINRNLSLQLESKANVESVKTLAEKLDTIQDANIELNNSINKGVNKALSRIGNISNKVDDLTISLAEEIEQAASVIEENYSEKIKVLEDRTLDITEEVRKYLVDLVQESRNNLITEIRKIKNEKPVEYIIEKAGKKNVKDWDSIQKDINKTISDGISNEATRLRKYIAVYSGGGSVAQQFAAGGTINGDLIINGSISATTFVGVSGSGTTVNTLDDVKDVTYTPAPSNDNVLTWSDTLSAWYPAVPQGGSASGAYLPLSGGVVTGNVSVPILSANGVQFDTTATPIANREGLLQWNSTDGTLDLGMDGGNIVQQVGQELFIKVYNASGDTIQNGSPVYVDGRQGNRPKIWLAKSDSHATSVVVGITTQDILDGSEGFVTSFGYVRQIKTNYSGWNEGDALYVSKTVAGQLTNIEPSAPHHSDIVATVGVIGGAGIGSILVNIIHHQTLESLSDINGTPLTQSGQFPAWSTSLSAFDFNYNINDYLPLSGGSISGTLSAQTYTGTQPTNWDANYTTFQSTSGNYAVKNDLTSYLPLTGGRITGSLTVTSVLSAPSVRGQWGGDILLLSQGGTGATTASTARTSLQLGTSDSPQFTGLTLTGNLAVNGTANLSVISPTTNILALRNGTNAEQFQFYRTYTSDTNLFRGTLSTSVSAINIIAEGLGASSPINADISLQPLGSGSVLTPNIIANGDITALGGSAEVDFFGLNNDAISFRSATTTLSAIGSVAGLSAVNLIPAGSFVWGTVVRVLDTLTGATSFNVGDGSDTNCWGDSIACTATTTTASSSFNITAPAFYKPATTVVISPNGGNFTAGRVRVAVHYMSMSGPTS